MRDGEPWFIAADVCRALDINNVSDAVARLDEDELTLIKTISGVQTREMNAISEAGLYALVLSSRKSEAKKFKRWVTHEVIPTIRKTGGYSVEQNLHKPATDAFIDMKSLAAEIQSRCPGVKDGIAFSLAIDIAGETHNAPLQSLKQLLLPAEHETGFLNATQIGERLGGIPPQAVNKLLAGKGVEFKVGKDWRLTELCKEYGEELPYTRNGHSGYQIR